MPLLAELLLARSSTRLAAYLAAQNRLIAIWVRRGGSAEDFVRRLAPRFRARYRTLVE